MRGEAARALAHSDSPNSRKVLRDLLMDRTASVREAAEQVLRAFADGPDENAASPPVGGGTLPLSVPSTTEPIAEPSP